MHSKQSAKSSSSASYHSLDQKTGGGKRPYDGVEKHGERLFISFSKQKFDVTGGNG